MKTIDVLQEDAYKHLVDNQRIACDFNTFKKGTEVYQTPHGVYIDLSWIEQTDVLNNVLNVTSEELADYKNVADWLVQQNEHVRYLPEIDTYIYIHDPSIQYVN